MAKYAKILDIRRKETKNGPKAVIQWAKGVEVTVDGVKVDFGEYNNSFLQTKGEKESFLTRMAEEGKLKEDFVSDQISFMEEKGITSLLEVKIED